jgi:transcriptional regulator with XRE-family HTH domain
MRLDVWLKEKGISQNEAARRLGIPMSVVQRIVTERLPPTLRNASKIVRATSREVDYEDLLGPNARRHLWRYDGRLELA